MNAHALLTSQGWRGIGHSLHKTDDSIGLAKPILVSKKNGNKGLGQKQHFTSDQWWMNAFDEQLKGLDTSKKGKVVQTVTNGRMNAIEKQGLGKWSLYASFVRGGFLEGTISKLVADTSSQDSSSDGSDAKETKKKSKKSKSPDETPEERRARKEAKRKRKEERAVRRAARRERKKKSSADDSTTYDAKEEKRRRRAKKEEKRRKRKLDALKSS
ncbi:Protein TMA23 [Paramyrothecium foliicola]|nr:Protein TMA23 [Paramyrothecium foliicola]